MLQVSGLGIHRGDDDLFAWPSSLIGVTKGTKALNATQKQLFLPRLCQTLRTRMDGSLTGKKLLEEKL